MVCGSKIKAHEDTSSIEIGMCAPNMISILDSIVNRKGKGRGEMKILVLIKWTELPAHTPLPYYVFDIIMYDLMSKLIMS